MIEQVHTDSYLTAFYKLKNSEQVNMKQHSRATESYKYNSEYRARYNDHIKSRQKDVDCHYSFPNNLYEINQDIWERYYEAGFHKLNIILNGQYLMKEGSFEGFCIISAKAGDYGYVEISKLDSEGQTEYLRGYVEIYYTLN